MGVDAAALDRLPWLSEELPGRADKRRRAAPLWVVLVIAMIAIAGIWVSAKTLRQWIARSGQAPGAGTTVLLPPLRTRPARVQIAPEPQHPVLRIRAARPPEEPAPAPAVHHAVVVKAEKAKHTTSLAKIAASAKLSRKSDAPSPAGRVIEIGAFGSAEQAKRAWASTLSAHPALGDLPAKPAESRNSHGETFYRMRISTTSQAHSEVLCQRMHAMKLSCAVLGLPGKAKVER